MIRKVFSLGLLAISLAGFGAEVWVLRVEGEIGRGTVSYLRKGLAESEAAGAQAVVIEFATPGGYLDAAQAARDLILGAKVKTIAYVNREAYSAGALLAIACERIYFAPGGVLGAATPVYFTGEEASEKMISAVRALFAATAEARGRDPKVAEAMVDPDVEIPELVERGKLLTLTSQAALEWGYSEGEVSDLAAILTEEALSPLIVEFRYHWTDGLVDILTTPWVAALLIALGALGILIETVTPGFGILGILGLSALGLFFWSHYLVGLAGWESLVFFLAGMIAILLEIFVFTATDFGLAGITGLILIGLGFYSAMVGPLTQPSQARGALGAVAVGLAVSVVGMALVLTWLPKSRLRLGGVILKTSIQERAVGQLLPAKTPWVGKRGTAVTDLRPAGKVLIEGEQVDVVVEEGFVPKGKMVEVVRDEGYRKVVREVKEG